MSDSTKDYLAVFMTSSGMVFYGRADSRESALKKCRDAIRLDWPGDKADLDDKMLTVNLYDVSNHEDVSWSYLGVFPKDNPEHILTGERVEVFL